MARYAISPEGANQLKELAACLLNCTFDILDQGSVLTKQISALDETLGIYANGIKGIVRETFHSIKRGQDDITKVCYNLNAQADEIMKLCQGDIWGGGGTQLPTTITGQDISDSFCVDPSSTKSPAQQAAAATAGFAVAAAGGGNTPDDSMVPTRTTPRDLVASQYGFNKDSDGNMVYDSPNEMNQYLYSSQGSADATFQGTCGLCSCANILRLSGVNASEKDMLAYASKTRDPNSFNGMLCETGYADPGLNGGTSPKSRQQILNHFGIDSGIFPISYDADGSISNGNLTQIADYVSAGRGVILSVHADVLWNDAPYGVEDYHAVTVTSVKKNTAGDILGFYICDAANGGTTYYSADRVRRSLTGSPMNVTYAIIR